jgi:hypothetical protein
MSASREDGAEDIIQQWRRRFLHGRDSANLVPGSRSWIGFAVNASRFSLLIDVQNPWGLPGMAETRGSDMETSSIAGQLEITPPARGCNGSLPVDRIACRPPVKLLVEE